MSCYTSRVSRRQRSPRDPKSPWPPKGAQDPSAASTPPFSKIRIGSGKTSRFPDYHLNLTCTCFPDFQIYVLGPEEFHSAYDAARLWTAVAAASGTESRRLWGSNPRIVACVRVALPEGCLSNTASSVFYGITCLIRLIEVAAPFATFEENLCQTSSVRQVVPPDVLT